MTVRMGGSSFSASSAAMLRASSAFFVSQPLRVADAVVQIRQHDDADDDRRNAFDQEHPLPAGQAVDAGKRLHRPARDGAADHARQRNCRHEEGGGAPAPLRRIPIREVQDDPREEAGFCQPQQEAHHVEHGRRGHEHHGRRDDAPRDHDPRDPDACAHAVQDHVARHFKEEVTDEEDAGAEPVDGLAELEVVEHLQLGKAHVDAIEIRDHVAQQQERNQAPRHFAVGGFFKCTCGLGWQRACAADR